MIVRVQVLVFTLLVAHQLQADVCQYFVGVHVQRGASTALEHIHRELVHAFAFIQYFITCLDDDVGNFTWDGLQLFVCHGGGFFYHHHAAYKLRNVADFTVADIEVFNRTQSMNTVVGFCWDFTCS
ncbi:hypothetical protein D3C71_1741080 [compost metagenome]